MVVDVDVRGWIGDGAVLPFGKGLLDVGAVRVDVVFLLRMEAFGQNRTLVRFSCALHPYRLCGVRRRLIFCRSSLVVSKELCATHVVRCFRFGTVRYSPEGALHIWHCISSCRCFCCWGSLLIFLKEVPCNVCILPDVLDPGSASFMKQLM